MLRCFSVERQSSHGGGGGGTYIPASAPHHKTECNQNISRTSHGVRDEGCCLHRDQEGERTTCCYCGWLLCRLSRRWFIRSLVPLFSFRRLKRQCFQGRQWRRRRRESQLRPLQPTDGPTDRRTRVLKEWPMQCSASFFSPLYNGSRKREIVLSIGRGRRLGSGRSVVKWQDCFIIQ